MRATIPVARVGVWFCMLRGLSTVMSLLASPPEYERKSLSLSQGYPLERPKPHVLNLTR